MNRKLFNPTKPSWVVLTFKRRHLVTNRRYQETNKQVYKALSPPKTLSKDEETF